MVRPSVGGGASSVLAVHWGGAWFRAFRWLVVRVIAGDVCITSVGDVGVMVIGA
jgi:hypothetical protein